MDCFLRDELMVVVRNAKAYPAEGEIFTLTISEPFTGLDMVRMDDYENWLAWKFTGKEITAPVTKRFKLVSVGYQPDFKSLVKELEKCGKIPQGQWRKAFKKAYSHAKGSWIGVADALWVNPSGNVDFPYANHTHMF